LITGLPFVNGPQTLVEHVSNCNKKIHLFEKSFLVPYHSFSCIDINRVLWQPFIMTKDFGDIVNLVIENGVDVDGDLGLLCQEFGTDALYTDLRTRIEELRHA